MSRRRGIRFPLGLNRWRVSTSRLCNRLPLWSILVHISAVYTASGAEEMKAFLARLNERKVIRATGVYAVSGYAIFQIANNMLPALNLPSWTVTLVAVLFLLGFPIVMLLAYALDWTPEGLKRAPPADGSTASSPKEEGSVAPARLGWLNWTLLGATVAVLIAFTGYYVGGLSSDSASRAVAAASERSIAVLPFVNFSDAADTEYFADGLTEELINGLAQIPDLKVAGRTSSFYFKDRNEDLREIGRALGVSHVLEGSVRRSADNLRITAQLIKVVDGFHLWSQTFDSRLDDAFVIQTQIARAVADHLQASLLLDDEQAAGIAARNPKAYQLELIARSRLRKQERRELEIARGLYLELLELEPENAIAYVGLAEATITLAQSHLALDFDEARQQSESAIETALALDPDSSEAWRVRGLIDRVLNIRSGQQRFADSALAALQRAVELDPRNADALALLAAQFLTRGQNEQAIAVIRRSLEIDPLSRFAQQQLGTALDRQGRFGEAQRQYESLIELYPDFTNARIALGASFMAQGKLDEAVRLLDDEALIRLDPLAGFMLANSYANLGMVREMTATLEGIREPRVAAALARAVLQLRLKRYSSLQQLAEQELRETNDPIWRSMGLLRAVLEADTEEVGAALSALELDPLDAAASAERSSPMDVLLAAEALRMIGQSERANRMVEDLLKEFDTAEGEYVPNDVLWNRTLALGALGRVEESLDALEIAIAQGFRTPIDFEYFLGLEDYPFTRKVTQDPRYEGLVARIEEENRRMRQNLSAAPR